MVDCTNCIEKCPQATAANEIAKGRMFAEREFINLINKIENGTLVEVVFCRDCKHRDPEDHKCDCGQFERQGCPFPVDDDYFCKYGERKGGDE